MTETLAQPGYFMATSKKIELSLSRLRKNIETRDSQFC
jgi:hypothetical protein